MGQGLPALVLLCYIPLRKFGKHSNRQSLEFIGVRGKMWIFKRVTQKLWMTQSFLAVLLQRLLLLPSFQNLNILSAVSNVFFFQSLSFLTSPISGFSAHCLECGCHQTQGPCFHPYLSLSDLVTCGPLADSCSWKLPSKPLQFSAPWSPSHLLFVCASLLEPKFIPFPKVGSLDGLQQCLCLFAYSCTSGHMAPRLFVPLSAACAWLSLSSPSQPFKSPLIRLIIFVARPYQSDSCVIIDLIISLIPTTLSELPFFLPLGILCPFLSLFPLLLLRSSSDLQEGYAYQLLAKNSHLSYPTPSEHLLVLGRLSQPACCFQLFPQCRVILLLKSFQ